MQRYELYKPAHLDWVQVIPDHWAVVRLKRTISGCVNGVWGSDPKGVDDIVCIRVADFNRQNFSVSTKKLTFRDIPIKDRASRILQKDDLLLEKSGGGENQLVGQVVKFDHDFDAVTSNFVAKMTAAKSCHPTYLVYLHACLYANKINFKSIKQTTGIQNLDSGSYLNELTPLPPYAEQKNIVRHLGQQTLEIDTAISKKERLIELLQEQADILIGQAVTRGLNPDVPMRDSGVAWIGQVPVHWKQLANRALFRERMEPGQADLPILSVSIHTAVSDDEQDGTENIRAKIRIEDKTSYKRVRPGDVTYNMMRAWQGAIGVVRVDGLVSPAYVVAAPLATINGAYFEYLYRTHGFIREMDRYSKGITDFRKRLYWDEFKQLVSLLPPLDEQIQIAAFAEQVVKKTTALTEKIRGQIDALNEFRASLIENLVTGKIKV